MGWKKVAESNELIILEKRLKDYKLKIEARKNEDSWEIFKTKINGDSSNLISEYTLDNKSEVKELIKKLKNEGDIKFKNKNQKIEKIEVSIRRVFKEEFIEKWTLQIEKYKVKNFLIIRFDKEISVDLVMDEKFKIYEKRILNEIEEKLGLRELGETILYDIYYFKKQNFIKTSNSEKEYNLDVLGIDFDDGENGLI